ncbi:MAG: CopG family transcriptional regulator [Proteobacteria bacterium]|nr:CopG family transcriptional regulator [Pseudomonadota bacterium]
MTDIDIDVPEELRSRLASAARRYGLSEHEFILKAIAEKLDRADVMADSSGNVDATKAINELRESRRGISVGEDDTDDLVADGRR